MRGLGDAVDVYAHASQHAVCPCGCSCDLGLLLELLLQLAVLDGLQCTSQVSVQTPGWQRAGKQGCQARHVAAKAPAMVKGAPICCWLGRLLLAQADHLLLPAHALFWSSLCEGVLQGLVPQWGLQRAAVQDSLKQAQQAAAGSLSESCIQARRRDRHSCASLHKRQISHHDSQIASPKAPGHAALRAS